MIAKNLDVIIKDEHDERRVFSDESNPAVEVKEVISSAKELAHKIGLALRVYELQPQERSMCEQNPVRSLFVNWAGNVSPCITLSYTDSRVFGGKRVQVDSQVFGNINNMY